MKRKLLVGLVLIAAMMLCAAVAFAIDVNPESVIAYGDIDQVTSVGGLPVIGQPTWIKHQTCEEKGIIQFFCGTDPQTGTTIYLTCYVKEDGHLWSSETDGENWGKVVEEPSCLKEGKAIDVCRRVLWDGTVCGKENPDHYRILDMTPHTFDDNYYEVAKQPSCAHVGYGIHLCIYCDHKKAADVKQYKETQTTELVIPMVPHDWTDWRVDEPSICGDYGEAHRACSNCGATQRLKDNEEVVYDQGVAIHIYDVIPQPNALWNDKKDLLAGKEFKNATNLNKALNEFANAVDYEVVKDWLEDCYTRAIKLSCKYCHGSYHEDVTYKMVYPLTVAHTWVLSPVDDPKTEPVEGQSIAPTCTQEGLNYYICDKDGDHGHPSTKYPKDDAFYTEVVPALGHDWLDWEVVETFEKDGELYDLMIRECDRCHGTENQIVKHGDDPSPVPPTPLKNGLVLDEDGKWRYYEDGEFVEKTGIVEYEGGYFWVVDGVVPNNANGLTICPDGNAYFLSQGQILRVSQVAEYKGEWFMIKNGELDESANGLYDYDGGTFVFAAGRLRKDVNGLWMNPKNNKWYFLSQGQVQNVSQVAEYNGEFFLIKNGVLDTAYEGTIEYDGQTFIVVEGQLYGPID